MVMDPDIKQMFDVLGLREAHLTEDEIAVLVVLKRHLPSEITPEYKRLVFARYLAERSKISESGKSDRE